MPPPNDTSRELELSERDIQFECKNCRNILIVDRDGEGLAVTCPHCGKQVVVPAYEGDPRRIRPAGMPRPEFQQAPPPLAPPPPAPPAPAPVPVPVPAPAPQQAAAPSPEPAQQPMPQPKRRDFDFSAIPRETLDQRLKELEQQLKENSSQRVELQGYINQTTIQLHRYQLRLRKLLERQVDYEAELESLKGFLSQ